MKGVDVTLATKGSTGRGGGVGQEVGGDDVTLEITSIWENVVVTWGMWAGG